VRGHAPGRARLRHHDDEWFITADTDLPAAVVHHVPGTAFGPARSPHTSFAISRSLNFCTLPVEVLGNSANTT
jgi:hypothetical protein